MLQGNGNFEFCGDERNFRGLTLSPSPLTTELFTSNYDVTNTKTKTLKVTIGVAREGRGLLPTHQYRK